MKKLGFPSLRSNEGKAAEWEHQDADFLLGTGFARQ